MIDFWCVYQTHVITFVGTDFNRGGRVSRKKDTGFRAHAAPILPPPAVRNHRDRNLDPVMGVRAVRAIVAATGAHPQVAARPSAKIEPTDRLFLPTNNTAARDQRLLRFLISVELFE